MTITHTLKMNLGEEELLQRLEMPLGDASSRKIELFLYANQKIWTIPENATVVIRYKKSDGTVGEYDTLPNGTAAWSANENCLTLSVAPQVLTAAGSVVLYACLYQEEKVLQTFGVEIFVKAPFAGNRATVSEDYSYMTNVLRGPVLAQDGQILMVGTVDAYGRVTEVQALDAAALVREKSNAVLYTAQQLRGEEKEQARANISAASKTTVDYLSSKFTGTGLILADEENGDRYVLYVANGKLSMKKE